MATTTPAQNFPVMEDGDDPDIPEDIMALALAIEKRVVGVYNNAADRGSKLPNPVNGQVGYLRDVKKFYYYDGTAWLPMFADVPAITSGTAVPSNSSGTNGDVFLQV